jgi:transposase-like protein
MMSEATHIESLRDEDLVDTRIAARMLGVSPNTLQVWRQQNKGPAYLRLGNKTIKYSVRDLTDFVQRIEP